tara:strand:- start:133 stop:594 length:462 start_codon:yes stop_codon:yes gene_type:complete
MEYTDIDNEENSPKGLREQLKKEQARRKEAESQLVGLTLSEMGLNANEGLGKAVTKLYDGPVDKDSISKFVADEFNYVSNQSVSEAPVEEPASKVEQVIASEQRVQQLGTVSNPNESQDIMEQLNDVITKGSVKDAIRAKVSLIDQINEREKK